MDAIYLIRHTTPAVAKGVCYGQTDLDVTDTFQAETEVIRQYLPGSIGPVYSSPLKRCTLLARELFPDRPLHLMDGLMEIHCGEWEMRPWDDLPKEIVDPWMTDFVQMPIPGGESYLDLHQRVTRCWESITRRDPRGYDTRGDAAIVAHGGVIRSILSGISDTPLIDSFKRFSLHYGCVIRVFEAEGGWQYEPLWNPLPTEREQHKPKSFYQKPGPA
jgi:alpha-ribazole phosphatase